MEYLRKWLLACALGAGAHCAQRQGKCPVSSRRLPPARADVDGSAPSTATPPSPCHCGSNLRARRHMSSGVPSTIVQERARYDVLRTLTTLTDSGKLLYHPGFRPNVSAASYQARRRSSCQGAAMEAVVAVFGPSSSYHFASFPSLLFMSTFAVGGWGYVPSFSLFSTTIPIAYRYTYLALNLQSSFFEVGKKMFTSGYPNNGLRSIFFGKISHTHF